MFGAPPGNVKDAIDTILVAWRKVDDERVNWSLEKAQLENKVRRLEESIEMQNKVHKELVEKIKKLEYTIDHKANNILGTQASHKVNGRKDLKSARKAKWRTLPAYLPKSLSPESIRELVKDLTSNAQYFPTDTPAFDDESGLDARSKNDDSVKQEDNEDESGSLDVKMEAPLKVEKNEERTQGGLISKKESKLKAAKVDDSTITTETYRKLKETASPSGQKWSAMSQLRSHLDGVRSVTFSPHSHWLMSGSEDGTVKLWNMDKLIRKKKASKKQEPVYTYRGHKGMVTCVTASEKMIFSSGVDGNVFAYGYPLEDQNQYTTFGTCSPFTLNCFSHSEAVWSVCSTKNLLLTACADGKVALWEATLKEQKVPKILFSKGVNSPAIPTSVTTTSSGSVVVSYSSGSVSSFDIETGKEIHSCQGRTGSHAMQVTSHPSLDIVVTANLDASFQLFDIGAGKCVDIKQNAHRDAVTCASIESNGVSMATGSHDQSIRVWDIRKLGITIDMDPNQHRKKYDEAVHSIAHHPRSPLLASGGADSTVKVFLGDSS